MSFRQLVACLSLSFVALLTTTSFAEENAPDSTPQLAGAVGKNGAIWENFYKFVVFIHAGKPSRLLYQNLEKFELHQQYLASLPEFHGMTRDQIDGLTYRRSADRRAYTGILVIHAGDDGIHRSRMSLAMEEAPSAELVAEIHALVKKSAHSEDNDGRLGTAFDFEILPHQEKGFAGQIASLTAKGISVYTGETLGASVSYTEAWNTGVLVTVANQQELDAKVAAGQIGSNTIVFAKEALREIPAVAGVISGVPLTPASHTVLLAQMYGVPVAYFREAEKIFADLDGNTIFLNANGSPLLPMQRRSAEFSLAPSTQDLQLLHALRAKLQLEVPFNAQETTIRDVRTLTQKDIGAYGGKSSQMGALMRRLPNNSVTKALGIPLGFSIRFLNTALASNGQVLSAFIAAQLSTLDDQAAQDAKRVEAVTSKIQKEIRGAKFPEEDLKLIERTLLSAFPGEAVKVRFRSTSNVEDGGEFNGAGLYDSTGVWLTGPMEDYIDKKLKKVIASLYNARAYMARRKFGVDESKVGMGILVHPAFTGETGNGVVRLIVDKKREYFHIETVSLRGDDEQVTHASGAGAAEVTTAMGRYQSKEMNDTLSIEQPYEGYSKQRSLFPSAIYSKLGSMMAEIAREYDEAGREIDIESEFKILTDAAGRSEVFIKQVRRVPHPAPRTLPDGSTFIVLAKNTVFSKRSATVASAYADLWVPKKVELEIDSFTEAQIRADQVKVKSVSFEIRGRRFTAANPKVTSKIDERYGGYNLQISLSNDLFPSMSLEVSNFNQNLRTHALTSSDIFARVTAPEKDSKILSPTGLDGSLDGYFETTPTETQPPRTGPYILKIAKSGRQIVISSPETKFYGEGDGRSVRLGQTEISGLWKLPLSIPGDAIGYGANHHQGDESFVFDLSAATNLNDKQRKDLLKDVGCYLYLLSGGYEDTSRSLTIKPDGKNKNWGKWRAEGP